MLKNFYGRFKHEMRNETFWEVLKSIWTLEKQVVTNPIEKHAFLIHLVRNPRSRLNNLDIKSQARYEKKKKKSWFEISEF